LDVKRWTLNVGRSRAKPALPWNFSSTKGEIRTKTVVVDGTVEGNITAGERCELRSGCTVHGDIESPRLVVDETATFIGSAKIATPKATPA
jgi:cytoskeletal protein CcmA (bactofilin family)